MNLESILKPQCTICAEPATSKKRILERISEIAAEHIPSQSAQTLLAKLMHREQMSSTGIGNGIAIPHGRIEDSDKVVAVLITADQAIGFDAIDNKPVDIFFALFVPENQCQAHLSTLAAIAQMFSDNKTCKLVRKMTSSEELYRFVTEQELSVH